MWQFFSLGEEQFEKDKLSALTSSQDTQRVQWVDIAKGIAIICVIIGHTVPHGPLRSALFSFHLPVFFVLSGFTTRLKPVSSMLPSLIKRLLVPYIMLTAGSRLIAAALGIEPLLTPLIFAQSLVWGSGVAVNGIPLLVHLGFWYACSLRGYCLLESATKWQAWAGISYLNVLLG